MSISVPSENRSLLWLVSSLLFEVFIITDDLISGAFSLVLGIWGFHKKTLEIGLKPLDRLGNSAIKGSPLLSLIDFDLNHENQLLGLCYFGLEVA